MYSNLNYAKNSRYKGYVIYNHKTHFEIKGYSMNSGTFFQSVEGNDLKLVHLCIDAAEDRKNDELVKTVFTNYYDIHKRIVYFSQIEYLQQIFPLEFLGLT